MNEGSLNPGMTTATFETDADKWRALAFALLVHLFAVGALFVGLLWQHEPPPAAAGAGEIEATLITSPSAAAAASRAIREAEKAERNAPPPPQPTPERAPQTAQTPLQVKPQQAQDQPDTVDQQRVSALATQAAEQRLKEQEEKHRQEQILLQQQAQDEAENKQRLATQQVQDQLAAIRVERAKAERDRKLAEEKLKQLEDQREHLPTQIAAAANPRAGANGTADPGLLEKYRAAMKQVAMSNWVHVGAPERVHCRISFTQIPGGEVIGDIIYENCPFDAAARETIERAMHKQSMPYTGFEKVFDSRPTIDFCYPEEACAK